MILSAGPTLEVPLDDLIPSPIAAPRADGMPSLTGVARSHILGVLEEANWMIAGPRGAAVRLGIKRTTLQSMMKRLGIERPSSPGYGDVLAV